MHATPYWLAVITGGGTGIGQSQALALSQLDIPAAENAQMHVILTGRREGPLRQVQQQLGGVDKCTIVPDCDVGDVECWERVRGIVVEKGGNVCFLGNSAGSYGPWDDMKASYETLSPQDMIDYNTQYITGVQLSYHYLVPFLRQGAATRRNGILSVVVNMSSSSSCLPRGMAQLIPMYHPVKNAMDAITRCAFGLYKDQGILSYGINPVVYDSEMTQSDAAKIGWTVDKLCATVNPLPVTGNPDDVGHVCAQLVRGNTDLEGGVCYVMMPIPPELGPPSATASATTSTSSTATSTTPTSTSSSASTSSTTSSTATTTASSASILVSTSVYGKDRDSIDGSVMRSALQQGLLHTHVYDSWTGKVIDDRSRLEAIQHAMTPTTTTQ